MIEGNSKDQASLAGYYREPTHSNAMGRVSGRLVLLHLFYHRLSRGWAKRGWVQKSGINCVLAFCSATGENAPTEKRCSNL